VVNLPPPYLTRLFDPYVITNVASKPRTYFMQKRSLYAEALDKELLSMRYVPQGRKRSGLSWSSENWSFTGPMNTEDYLRRLASSRWVLNLDLKASAGQVSAEASLLGVPTISVHGKANPERLLPPQLLLPRALTQSEAVMAVRSIIDYYDDKPEEYALLADEVRRTAALQLTPPTKAQIYKLATTCCRSVSLATSPVSVLTSRQLDRSSASSRGHGGLNSRSMPKRISRSETRQHATGGDMNADIMTKPLSLSRFQKLVKRVHVQLALDM